MIPSAAFELVRAARHAAIGPATERMLSGQPSGFEERIVLTHEVTCVGCNRVGRAAAR